MSASRRGIIWDDVQLGEMVTLHRGYDLPSALRSAGPIPVVSSSGITGYHDEAKIEPPGVVTGRYGTLGEVFFVDEPFWPLNTTLYASDFHGNDERFIAYFLRAQGLGAHSGAAAVPGVNRNHLHRLPARRPPVGIQRKIASILSAYDNLIDNDSRRIRILGEMAQRIYREWFVDFRYPGHEDVPLVESELGSIPNGWCVLPFGDVVAVNARTAKRLDHLEYIDYLDISSVDRGSIRGWKRLASTDAPGRARRLVVDGDVIWSTVRPNRRAYAQILDPPATGVVSTGFAVLSPKSLPPAFVYAMSTSDAFVNHLVNHTTGAAYPAVTGRTFEEMPVAIPLPTVVQHYNQIVEPALLLIGALRRQLDVLRSSRDLLLPGLVSGEIDVDELDIETAELAA